MRGGVVIYLNKHHNPLLRYDLPFRIYYSILYATSKCRFEYIQCANSIDLLNIYIYAFGEKKAQFKHAFVLKNKVSTVNVTLFIYTSEF